MLGISIEFFILGFLLRLTEGKLDKGTTGINTIDAMINLGVGGIVMAFGVVFIFMSILVLIFSRLPIF